MPIIEEPEAIEPVSEQPEVPASEEVLEMPSFDDDAFAAPDPQSIVTIRTSGGDTRHVPVTEARSASQIILDAGLTVVGQVQYWLNGAQITGTDMVAPGSTLTTVGSVKGG